MILIQIYKVGWLATKLQIIVVILVEQMNTVAFASEMQLRCSGVEAKVLKDGNTPVKQVKT